MKIRKYFSLAILLALYGFNSGSECQAQPTDTDPRFKVYAVNGATYERKNPDNSNHPDYDNWIVHASIPSNDGILLGTYTESDLISELSLFPTIQILMLVLPVEICGQILHCSL